MYLCMQKMKDGNKTELVGCLSSQYHGHYHIQLAQRQRRPSIATEKGKVGDGGEEKYGWKEWGEEGD